MNVVQISQLIRNPKADKLKMTTLQVASNLKKSPFKNNPIPLKNTMTGRIASLSKLLVTFHFILHLDFGLLI